MFGSLFPFSFSHFTIFMSKYYLFEVFSYLVQKTNDKGKQKKKKKKVNSNPKCVYHQDHKKFFKKCLLNLPLLLAILY